MTFSRNVDKGPRIGSFHFGEVPHSERLLTFDLPKIIGQDQRPSDFDHKVIYCYVTWYYSRLNKLCDGSKSQCVGKGPREPLFDVCLVQMCRPVPTGDHRGDSVESSEEMFRSGFHLCAKEVLEYVASQESSRDLTPSHVIGHIQKVAAEVLHHEKQPGWAPEKLKKPAGQPHKGSGAPAKNCVPVIQRTNAHGVGEQSGSDTDTDSGYGGEHDKRDPKAQWTQRHAKEGKSCKQAAPGGAAGGIKQEGDEPQPKKSRCGSPEEELLPGHIAGDGSYMSLSPSQNPFCLPFYFLPPASAPVAAYLPMLEKCWYPGGVPILYPGMNGSGACLSPEALASSLVMSPRAASPVPHQAAMDSPALHKALKQVPPLNLETRD